MNERPELEEADPTVAKRAKLDSNYSIRQEKPQKKARNAKERRETKIDSKNNKGLIGSATMLTFVGMLNYMGNGEMPQNVCGGTQLDEQFVDSSPLMTAINNDDESQTIDSNRLTNDWSLDRAFEPKFDDYDFIGDLMPANPDLVASLDLS